MTTRKVIDRESGNHRIKMVECPVCDGDLDDQEGFAGHWRTCSENPEVDDAE